MRLNSETGVEGSPVSSINCDRPLHSRIRGPELCVGFQITDGCRLCSTSRSLMHQLRCGKAGMAGGPWIAQWPVICRAYKALAANETLGRCWTL